jgi:glucosamine kinase
MSLHIGVDGGGTTTRAAIIDENYAVLGYAESDSSNLFNLGIQAACANICSAIDGALTASGRQVRDIDTFGFGLAGTVGENERKQWRSALGAYYGNAIVVDEDVAAALAGAFGPEELAKGGAVLIAGTGSNCFGQSADGRRARADGWGPLIGDRGSGYWLGHSAIQAAVAAIDGAAPATSLQSALLEHFGVENLDALVGVVYAPDFRRDRIAAFVPHVLRAAGQGDIVAHSLLVQAGQQLGATASAVLKPLGVTQLALTGGLLQNVPEVRQGVREALDSPSAGLSSVVFREPRFEAVVGAALLPLVNQ